MLKNQYNLYLKTNYKHLLTIVPTPSDAKVRFSLKDDLNTTLTIYNSNPNVVIHDGYTGHKETEGLEIINLSYVGVRPYLYYDTSTNITCSTTGLLSGFVNSSLYDVVTPITLNIGNSSWEITEKITTGYVDNTDNKIVLRLSNDSNTANVLSIFYKYYSDTARVNFGFSLGTGANNSYNILADSGSNNIEVQSNTTYWLKLAYNGINYVLSYSTDGTTYNPVVSYNDSTNKIASACNYTTIAHIGSGDLNGNYAFTEGIVDLRETSIISSNTQIWQGILHYVWSTGSERVTLEDYDLSIESGIPQPEDTIKLTYNTVRLYPIDEGNSIEVPKKSEVWYSVEKYGYIPVYNSTIMGDEDITIYVTLLVGLDLEDYIYELTNNDWDMGAIDG